MISRILSNTGWIIGCKLLKAILVFLVTMMMARYLGPSDYGILGYAASLVLFVTPLMKLGLDSTLVYEIVNHPNDEGCVLGTSITLNVIMSFFCILGVYFFVCLTNANDSITISVCALYSLLLFFQAVEMIQYWFQAKLLAKYSAITMCVSYILVTIFQFTLLLSKKSVEWFAISNSVDYGLIAAMLIFLYKRNGGQNLHVSFKMAKDLLANSHHYIVASLIVVVYAQTDRIMLKFMMDSTSVGLYTAATTCASMFSFVFAAIIDSARPSIYEGLKISHEIFSLNLKRLYAVIIYFSLLVSAAVSLMSPIIIHIMYGEKYSMSINALRLVVWFTTFSYLGVIRNVWMVAVHKQKYLWIINLSSALLNVILNYCLIPIWGIIGASFASLCTQIFANFILGFIISPIRENNTLMLAGVNPLFLKQEVCSLLQKRKNKN